MRVFALPVLFVPFVALIGCGQKLDHPGAAPPCDSSVMRCTDYSPPEVGSVGTTSTGAGGGPSDETSSWSGIVLAFSDALFNQGNQFTGQADVTATGESGRVTGHYDGMSFALDGVLKDPANWFMVTPDPTSGTLPTITPVDTRSTQSDAFKVGLASANDVDGIFLASSGTERSDDRAQLVLRVVDQQSRSVTGVHATATAEVVVYRAAATWVGNDIGTDDSGMIFLANMMAGTALTAATITLTGAVTATVDVRLLTGATTVVTTIVSN